MDQLSTLDPTGSGFDRALFKYYYYLAHSFGDVSAPPGTTFDQEGAFALADLSNSVSAIADAYARKALASANGEEVSPEQAPNDADDLIRGRLLRALVRGRDQTPELAARAQADFDCWMLNRRIDALQAAAQVCKKSLESSLPALEASVARQAAPPVSTPPTAANSTPVTPAVPAPNNEEDHNRH